MEKARFVNTIPAYYPVPDGKGSWISQGELSFYSAKLDRVISVPEGSHNNLASIPPGARNLFAVNGPHRISAALHDYLYEQKGLIDDGEITRAEADALFLEAMSVSKISVYRAFSDDLIKSLERYKEIKLAFYSPQPLVAWHVRKLMYTAVRSGGWYYWR